MLSRTTIVPLRCARSTLNVRNLSARASAVLGALDISTTTEVPGVYDGRWGGTGDILESVCPTTGEVLARVQSVRPLHPIIASGLIAKQASPRELHDALDKSKEAYLFLRKLPPPRRGDVLRQLREALAAKVRHISQYALWLIVSTLFSEMHLVHWYPSRWVRSRQKASARCKNSLILYGSTYHFRPSLIHSDL